MLDRPGGHWPRKPCYRFTRPGVIPTSTPHMDRLLGPRGIGQAGSDKVDTDEADEVIDAVAEFRREEATSAVGSNVKH